jgi:TPP-dependent pyruvate/acetoin dehydrogenase alpha subunit
MSGAGGGKGVVVRSKKRTAGKKKTGAAPENPLVPHAVLRQMYQKMVELRLLEAYTRRELKSRVKLVAGNEASRASLAQGLGEDDLMLDSRPAGLMDHLLGAKLRDVQLGIAALKRWSKKDKAPMHKGSKRLLPYVAPAEERLLAGLGAAMLFKQRGLTDGVVIFVEHGEASKAQWRRAFTLAAKEELPVVFVALPDPKAAMSVAAGVSGISHGCGVPGIHVDASDVIALYRVVQESWMRLRNGGGPVLIEGVPFHTPGKKSQVDPVKELGGYLLNRQVCSEAWLARTEESFRRKLKRA